MAYDLAGTISALQMVLGNSPAVEFLSHFEEYVIACEKERDEAKAAEAAARAALEKAQADASAMAAKLSTIVLDLADGIFDGPVPVDVVVEGGDVPVAAV